MALIPREKVPDGMYQDVREGLLGHVAPGEPRRAERTGVVPAGVVQQGTGEVEPSGAGGRRLTAPSAPDPASATHVRTATP